MSFNLSDDSLSEDEETEQEITFVLPQNRTRHLKDTKCNVCRINFNIPGVVHTEKGTCLFCYRGVCKRCLVSSKNHPETSSKEKICKVCIVEFKKLRFFSSKIEESRLEISQLRLEVELSIRENQEITEKRKEVQSQLEEAREIANSVDGKKENTTESLKERLSSLTIRHERSEASIHELIEKIRELQKILKEKKIEIEQLKKHCAEKEKEEHVLKQKIAEKKEETLKLLNTGNEKMLKFEDVEGKLTDLKTEVNHLEKELEHLNTQIALLKQQEETSQARQEKNEEELEALQEKLKEENNEKEERILEETKNDLVKYDEVIENLKKRLALLEKKQSKSFYMTNDRYEKQLRQIDILANIAHTKKNERYKRDPTGSTSCQKCIIN